MYVWLYAIIILFTCHFLYQDDTSGDYRNALLALVVGGPPPMTSEKCNALLVNIFFL